MIAEEGISVNVVAGSGVKQPKRTKEGPKQDILLPKGTGHPPEKPHTVGKEQQGNGEHSTFPLPGAAAYGTKGRGPLFNAFIAPLPSQGSDARRIQLAGLREGAAGDYPGDVEAIQAQQVVQPLLHRVPGGVSDGLLQGDLMQCSRCSPQHTRT